jgi:hypothetical protein
MNTCVRVFALLLLTVVIALPPVLAQSGSNAQPGLSGLTDLPSSARQQIAALLAEKNARTPAQRKISSSLIYKIKASQGINLVPRAPMLKPLVPQRTDGRVDIQILGQVTKSLISAIERSGGKLIYGSVNGPLVRALVPLNSVETLAQRSDVRGIHEAFSATTQQQLARMRAQSSGKAYGGGSSTTKQGSAGTSARSYRRSGLGCVAGCSGASCGRRAPYLRGDWRWRENRRALRQ